MPSRDFEALLKSRNRSFKGSQDLIEKRLAEMYLDAYREADKLISDLYATLPAEGDKLVAAAKYGRLKRIQDEIAANYKTLTGKAIDMTGKFSAQSIVDSYKSYEWSLDQHFGVGVTNFGIINNDAIIASVFSENSGLNYIKTFNKNLNVQLSGIQAAITRGLALGQSYDKTARGLKDQFERGYNDAVRVVRTESGRNWSEGALAASDKARELGIKTRRKWSAGLDGRTRLSHARADGQYADEKTDMFTVGGYSFSAPRVSNTAPASEIVNCRCALIEELVDYPPKYRNIGGESEPYQTYSQWASQFGWTASKGWPKGSEAYMAGLKSLKNK